MTVSGYSGSKEYGKAGTKRTSTKQKKNMKKNRKREIKSAVSQ